MRHGVLLRVARPRTSDGWLRATTRMVPMIPMHLGTLHPVEQVATYLLAFGPFIMLGVVVLVRRRAEAAEDHSEPEGRIEP
jgi:hypothetical protein